MKNLKFLPIVFIAFFALTLTSCKKDTEDRLPGDAWSMNYSVAGGDESYSGTGSVTFNEDGTGTSTFEGYTSAFSWTATETTITFIGEVYQIETNDKSKQVFTATETEDGDTYVTTITLTR